jgi:hypothetical protein
LAIASDDFLNVDLSLKRLHDDNFLRSPEAGVAEEITVASAGLRLNETIASQALKAQWHAVSYNYDQFSDLDAVVQQGKFSWKGQFGERIKTDVELLRDSSPVDRLEFTGKDIVTKDDATAKIGYGTGERLTAYIGGHQTRQNHSEDMRDGLDFNDQETFFELAYKTAGDSTLSARVENGERNYPNYPSDTPVPHDLDFTYKQLSVDANFVLSPKTSIELAGASFSRDGIVNNGKGSVASLAAKWTLTPKLQMKTGYTYRQPAIGEISDSPFETQGVFISANWQLTPKISLGTNLRGEEQQFDDRSIGLAREEKLYNIMPLAIIYNYSDNFSFRIEAERIKRESPLEYRNFLSNQISANILFFY